MGGQDQIIIQPSFRQRRRRASGGGGGGGYLCSDYPANITTDFVVADGSSPENSGTAPKNVPPFPTSVTDPTAAVATCYYSILTGVFNYIYLWRISGTTWKVWYQILGRDAVGTSANGQTFNWIPGGAVLNFPLTDPTSPGGTIVIMTLTP